MSVRPFHHQRPLAAAAAAYGAGVWTGVRFAWRPVWVCFGLLLSLLAVWLLPRIGRKRVVGAVGACLFLGMLLSGLAAHPFLPPEGKYLVRGTLSSDVEMQQDGVARVYLENVSLSGENGRYALGKVYWTYHPDSQSPFLPREGDAVTFSGSLYHPNGQVNPFGFDARMFYLQKGAAACISGCADGQTTGHPGRGLRSLTYGVHLFLTGRVREIFGADSALPEALLLGSRTELPEDTARAFSDAGLAHLLAVSGLHVSLLAEALFLPLRSLMNGRKRLALLAVFLLFYCAVLDFAAPVVRSSLLMIFAKGRRIIRRAPDGLTSLSAAFLLILLFRPLDLFSASFQLSFCAVLGIAVTVPIVRKRLMEKSLGKLWLMLLVTAAATVFTAVPTIQTFHRVSLLGPLVNPLACQVFALLLPVYALTLLLGCIWLPAGQWIAGIVNILTGWLTTGVEALGNLPFASVRAPALPFYCVLAVAAALALLTRYVLLSFRRRAALAAGILAAAFIAWPAAENKDARYVQLAMGQADSAVILQKDATAVIDAGSWGNDLAAYLLSTGRQADTLILTHLHTDHCLGVRQLLEQRVPVGRVILPVGAEEQIIDAGCLDLLHQLSANGATIEHVSAGDTFAVGGAHFTVLWPDASAVRPGQDANRNSLALLCEMDGVRILTTGDLTGTYEMYAARDADVLKAAHHGSKSSTGDAFLRAVSPEAVILTGSGNGRAALPHPDTIARLDALSIPWWNTGNSGAVTVTVRNGQAFIETFLSEKETP